MGAHRRGAQEQSVADLTVGQTLGDYILVFTAGTMWWMRRQEV